MISSVYISHAPEDEDMALQLSRALWRVGLESYAALYNLSPAISLAGRVSFGIRNSEAMVALLTREGCRSPEVSQEIGLARGKSAFSDRASEATGLQGGELQGRHRPLDQDHSRPEPAGVAEGNLPPMRRGDDPVSHAAGGGRLCPGKGKMSGDRLQLLPEQDRSGCEDI